MRPVTRRTFFAAAAAAIATGAAAELPLKSVNRGAGPSFFDLERMPERTRRMGVNTLAYRLPQDGTFFSLDADCVGITRAIPWELNRQWMDLIARSGTGLFISPGPAATGPEQKAAIREAFAIAAAGESHGRVVDWFRETTPIAWEFRVGRSGVYAGRTYEWTDEGGTDPYPV